MTDAARRPAPGGEQSPLIGAIFGPTAVGKTRVAFEVAQLVDAEVISADSMQVYRGLPILTDQPPAGLLESVPHHLIAAIPLSEDYSAGRFSREAAALIGEIAARRRLPLIAGGTGLYMRALLGGFSFAGEGAGDRRAKWERLIEQKGLPAAMRELEKRDPAAAAVVDRENPRRVVRALEAAEAGASIAAERGRLWSPGSTYSVLSFGLELPRDELYRRIDERVDTMLAAGAVEEVRQALKEEVSRTAAQAIGFADIAAYLDGEQSLEQAAAAIKQKSRRYAKRQLTWMRKMPDVVRIDLAERSAGDVAKEIAAALATADGS